MSFVSPAVSEFGSELQPASSGASAPARTSRRVSAGPAQGKSAPDSLARIGDTLPESSARILHDPAAG
jgi:hypothetical protein